MVLSEAFDSALRQQIDDAVRVREVFWDAALVAAVEVASDTPLATLLACRAVANGLLAEWQAEAGNDGQALAAIVRERAGDISRIILEAIR